jgi:hypothetical protein
MSHDIIASQKTLSVDGLLTHSWDCDALRGNLGQKSLEHARQKDLKQQVDCGSYI